MVPLFGPADELNPRHILDLVPLSQETRVSGDGEAFADHVRKYCEEVRAVLKASNEAYSSAVNQHCGVKDW